MSDRTLNEVVRAATESASRRYVGPVVAAFAAPRAVVHAAGHVGERGGLPSHPYREFASTDLFAALAAARPRREPRTKVRYSNFGAGLLGWALASSVGLTYERLIAERVTGPDPLSDTVVRRRPDQRRRP